MRYSPERKESVLRKMIPPHNRSIKLTREEGISPADPTIGTGIKTKGKGVGGNGSFVYKAVLAEGCILKPLELHSDNGSPQKGSTLNAKLESLGIMPSFSRTRVSNDNPYSEALFRTCKYRPGYPRSGFETIGNSCRWVNQFVLWYNDIHLHSEIRFVAPNQRNRGEDRQILQHRQIIYEKAKSRNGNRWSGATRNWSYIDHVWLNPPKLNKDNSLQLKAT